MRDVLPRDKFLIIVFVSALLVGVFYAGPQALIWRYLTENGQSFVSTQITHRGDMAQVYMPKAREVYDGHFPPTDFHTSNTSGLYTIFPALPPLMFLPFFVFSGGDANTALLLADFMLPAIIFILFFILGWVVLKNRLWSLFLAFVGTLTPMAIHLPLGFKGWENFLNIIAKNFFPLVNTKLDKLFLDRIDDPLLTYLIFLPAIALLFYFWQKPTKKGGVWGGIFIGLLAYTYFHYWVLMVIFAGILFIWTVVKKNHRERLKPFVFLIAALTVVLIPYLVMYLGFYNLPFSGEYINRIGTEEGRFFRLFSPFSVVSDYLFYIFLAFLVWKIFYKKGKTEKSILYWSFIISAFTVWNIQLVTGFIPVPSHFWRAIAMIVFIILFDLAYEASKRVNKKYVAAGIIILISLLSLKKAVNLAYFVNPPTQFVEAGSSLTYAFDSDVVESWDWINKNLPNEPRIISDSFITSYYLLSQTSARPYLATGFNTLLSNEEIAERFLVVNKLFGVSREILAYRLRGAEFGTAACVEDKCDAHSNFNQLKGTQHMFVNTFKKDTDEYRYIDEVLANELLVRYGSLEPNWQNIAAEYVYFGPWEREFGEARLFENTNLKPIYRNASVQIFEVLKENNEQK